MDIKIIATLMIMLIMGLMVFALFYEPKEKQKMSEEVLYFKSLRLFAKNKSDENLRQMLHRAAVRYFGPVRDLEVKIQKDLDRL